MTGGSDAAEYRVGSILDREEIDQADRIDQADIDPTNGIFVNAPIT